MIILAAIVAALAAFFLVILIAVYFQHVRRMSIFYRLRRHHIIEAGQTLDQPYLERMRQWLRKAAAPIAEHGPIQALDFRMRQAGSGSGGIAGSCPGRIAGSGCSGRVPGRILYFGSGRR